MPTKWCGCHLDKHIYQGLATNFPEAAQIADLRRFVFVFDGYGSKCLHRKYMKKTVFFTFALLLLLGCQRAQRPLSIKKQQMICHELLFDGWPKEDIEKMQKQNHWVYVDSFMEYRPELTINGYRIGKEDVPPPNLKKPLCASKIPIIIPDSLKSVYKYFNK